MALSVLPQYGALDGGTLKHGKVIPP